MSSISLKVPDYILKSKNMKWESPLCRTCLKEYPYKLIVRPNGLKFTEGYGECLGVWLKPEPFDLKSPAEVKLRLKVETPNRSVNTKLVTPMKFCTWDVKDTARPNPAFCFDLTAIKHKDILEANCIDDSGSLTLIIEEEE